MKDATPPQIKKEMKQNDFNPRTHIGCDLILRYLIAPFAHFNPRTHIGCDYVIKAFFERKKNFNPRTHIGCDNQYRLKRDLHVEFQSTHPYRMRLYIRTYLLLMYFISIHAPI